MIPMGFRTVMGVEVPSGSRIERYNPTTKNWVYVDQIHPDDAEKYIIKFYHPSQDELNSSRL